MKRRLALAPIVLLLSSIVAQGAVLCTTSATTVAFGTVAFSAVNSTGTVTVNCIGSASFTVALSTGGSGSFSPRNMGSGTNRLQYNLYTDSAHTQVWGDGTSGTVTNNSSFGLLGGTVTFTSFGQVPAQSAPAPGTYTDTITVTVSY